jgi:hypothetical protein
LLGRLGATRLLVRSERTDLALYDCAFERRAANGGRTQSTLSLRLPAGHDLRGVAAIEFLDLSQEPTDQLLASTAPDQPHRLTLMNGSSRPLLPTATSPIDLSDTDKKLRVSLPTGLDLRRVEFPALRFVDGNGRRLLTLPVLADVENAVQ